MSRTSKFFYSTITTALLQIMILFSGLIIPYTIIHIYGSEVNGLLSSITQLIQYATLVEAGLSAAMIYALYKPLAAKDNNSINRILVAAKKTYEKSGYWFLFFITIIALGYPLFISVDNLQNYEIFFLVLIIGLSGVLEFFTLAKYRAILTADQKTYVISLISIIHVLLNTIIIVILSYAGFSIILVRSIALVSVILRTVLLRLYVNKKYNFLDYSVVPDYESIDRRKYAIYMQILTVIHSGSPILIAALFLTLNDVSIYTIYYLVIQGLITILSIFTTGISAGFGEIIAIGDKLKLKKAFEKFEIIYFSSITLVYYIAYCMYIPFIRIYTSNTDINYVNVSLAIFMAINGFIYSLKTPYSMLLIASGKYKESRIQNTVQGLLVILFGIPLSLLYGLIGIVIAMIISNLYRLIDFIFFTPKHLTHYSFKKSIIMIFAFCILFLLLVVISNLIYDFQITSILNWIVVSIIIGLTGLSIIVLFNYIFFNKLAKETTSHLIYVIKNNFVRNNK